MFQRRTAMKRRSQTILSIEIVVFSWRFSVLGRNCTNERRRVDSLRMDAQGSRIIGRREVIPRGETTSSSLDSQENCISACPCHVRWNATRHLLSQHRPLASHRETFAFLALCAILFMENTCQGREGIVWT